MTDKYSELFKELNQINPPLGLGQNILAQIQLKKKHDAKVNLTFFGGAVLMSLVGSIFAFRWAGQALAQSGFYQSLSLIFSDGAAMLTYWQEFALSVAESLPMVEITVFLAAIFALLESLKLTIKNLKTAFYSFN